MKPKSIAIAGMLLSPFIDTALVVTLGDAGKVMDEASLVAGVVGLAFMFMWLHYDGLQIGYRRTALFNTGIALLPVIFVPIYIYRSRPPGKRGGAFLRLLGFFLAWLATAVLAQMVMLVIFFGHDLF